jgi:hypothetical protein
MGEYISHPYVNSPRAERLPIGAKDVHSGSHARYLAPRQDGEFFRVVGAAVAWTRYGAGQPPPIALAMENRISTVVAAALLLRGAPTNGLMQLVLRKSVCD